MFVFERVRGSIHNLVGQSATKADASVDYAKIQAALQQRLSMPVCLYENDSSLKLVIKADTDEHKRITDVVREYFDTEGPDQASFNDLSAYKRHEKEAAAKEAAAEANKPRIGSEASTAVTK